MAVGTRRIHASGAPGLLEGGWTRLLPGDVRVGTTTRTTPRRTFIERLSASTHLIWAGQVHGASIAVVDPPDPKPWGQVGRGASTIPGCDALLTRAHFTVLLVQTADCMPIFVVDPIRQAIGIAHVGWRGLRAHLPARLIGAFRHTFQSDPASLRVAIGPAIRACCYEVGSDVAELFGPFALPRHGRWRLDLTGAALQDLRQAGVASGQVQDSGCCTACEPKRWFSLRREGTGTGRLISCIVLR